MHSDDDAQSTAVTAACTSSDPLIVKYALSAYALTRRTAHSEKDFDVALEKSHDSTPNRTSF